MCGFVTLFNKNQQPVNPDLLKKMTDMIMHRGPDDEGFYFSDHVGLGFRRLSIIDLEGGHQPLTNETEDIWMVFNGEIYNYKELRSWLMDKGHQFNTDSDSETIIHLYEELGEETPTRLRGMFAFVIWDKRTHTLFGARDHFGIKPLYWAETSSSYAFASEIKSIMELEGVNQQINPTSLVHYLTFQYTPDPETMFSNVHKIPPGHFFAIQHGSLKIKPYWEVRFAPDESKPFSYFVEKTRDILTESVEKHRMSDVPRGAFLSSGVDSTTIVALLRQYEDVKTFSVGFDIPGYSELDYARRSANYLGTQHHEVTINAKQYLDKLPQLVWHQDDPVADPSAIALYFVAELASKYITVVLSGEGADEFFGGYNIYREPESLKIFSTLPSWLRSGLGQAAKILPAGVKGRNFLIRGSKSVEERFFGNAFLFSEELKQSVLSPNFPYPLHSPMEITKPYYDQVQSYDDTTKMQYIDIHTWLPGNILMKADKMTMANSLELRVPFIDPEVFQFASSIPVRYKIANGTTKFVLREAMKDLIPEEIHMRRKLGFPVPTRVWLKNEFYSWAKELIYDSKAGHLINKSYLFYLLDEHKEERADHSRKIWAVLIFLLWHQIYVEKAISFQPYVSPLISERESRKENRKEITIGS
ncbi:asparagine synthase (glutamine-hydrolyzing) [Microaerobacter geothermalis]|uniref:asparagine synthase (glutamine-hydrolyzing) n=1 Tax=Microaerobacter geothermalis TaxID=674972 RepID=UPI001F39855D|nr:asparagine synthase (glutamine-hydrolyzing) [Microaerobacter geothermalis]MCF6092888.1 asparagine synthase (glutamine-hydrolyzing) [Microaerobacter geothermalis]